MKEGIILFFKIHDIFLELRKSFKNITTTYMFCVFPPGAGILQKFFSFGLIRITMQILRWLSKKSLYIKFINSHHETKRTILNSCKNRNRMVSFILSFHALNNCLIINVLWWLRIILEHNLIILILMNTQIMIW